MTRNVRYCFTSSALILTITAWDKTLPKYAHINVASQTPTVASKETAVTKSNLLCLQYKRHQFGERLLSIFIKNNQLVIASFQHLSLHRHHDRMTWSAGCKHYSSLAVTALFISDSDDKVQKSLVLQE